jgi:hypothetical protein
MRLVIAGALALAAAPAVAQPAQPHDASAQLRPGEVLLEVDTTGSVMSRPDVMTISAGVVTTGRTASEALSANAARAAGVVEAVRRHRIDARDVRTSDLSVEPAFEKTEETDEREPRIMGYKATNDLELRLRDLARAPLLLDAMLAAGANTVRGPSFSLSDEGPSLRQARSRAVAAAREEAETYAGAMGMRISRTLRLSERRSWVDSESGEAIMVTGSRARTSIEPGEIQTQVRVWVDYALVPN